MTHLLLVYPLRLCAKGLIIPVPKLLSLIGNFQKRTGITVQFITPSLVLSPEHLCFAGYFALKAFKSDAQPAISRSLGMETLLYTSGQRQIEVCLDRFGLKGIFGEEVACVVICENLDQEFEIREFLVEQCECEILDQFWIPDESKLAQIKQFYEILTSEIEAVSRISGIIGKTSDQVPVILDCIIQRMIQLSIEG